MKNKSSNMIACLKNAVKNKIIRPIDFYFSQFITKTNPIVMLVSACISYENSHGYIFLPMVYFKKNYFFSNFNKELTETIVNILGKNIDWSLELIKHTSVSNGSIPTPLVLFENKIYFYKMWKSEKNIFNCLYERNFMNQINIKTCSKILDKIFPEKEKNIQKIAVALTLINNITFITGGPGTGKTTTIIKIIIALIKNSTKPIKIQLSAPTGKAAKRLNKILQDNSFNIYLNQKEKKYIPLNAVTIHQLLRIEKISQKPFFNKKNYLDTDVLIIDETSMIDILVMEKIFFSISKLTKIIFLGDHNQLPPIEYGSIFKHICYYANNQYSLKYSLILKELTKYTVFHLNKTKIFINDNICILKKIYRFNKNSGIDILSNAILRNKKLIFNSLFKNMIKNVFFYETNNLLQYKNMIKIIILNYTNYWEKINNRKNIKEIITTFQDYQVLCILRESIFGVNFLNKVLEETMNTKNIIKYFYIDQKIWYVGKPIIITQNNKLLELYNGDIGITNISNTGNFQVSFLEKDDNIKNIPVNILNNYESAWAITVHKSQGSEYSNVALILPNFNSKILTKDILYTATTRCKEKLYIFTNKKIFTNIFKNNIKILKNINH